MDETVKSYTGNSTNISNIHASCNPKYTACTDATILYDDSTGQYSYGGYISYSGTKIDGEEPTTPKGDVCENYLDGYDVHIDGKYDGNPDDGAPDTMCLNGCTVHYKAGQISLMSASGDLFADYVYTTPSPCTAYTPNQYEISRPPPKKDMVAYEIDDAKYRLIPNKKACYEASGVTKCVQLVEHRQGSTHPTGRDVPVISITDSETGEVTSLDTDAGQYTAILTDSETGKVLTLGGSTPVPSGETVNINSGDSDSGASSTKHSSGAEITNATNTTGGFSTTPISSGGGSNNSPSSGEINNIISSIDSVASNTAQGNQLSESQLAELQDIKQAIIDKEWGLTAGDSQKLTDIEDAVSGLGSSNQASNSAIIKKLTELIGAVKGSGSGSGSGSDTGTGSGTGNCEGTACATEKTLKEIKDGLTGDQEKGEKGNFNDANEEALQEFEDKKEELKELFQGMIADASGWTSGLNTASGGSLPVAQLPNNLGSIDLNSHPEFINIAGQLILFIGYFMSFIILISKY